MADADSEKIEKYAFLYDRKAPVVFAKLDYLLRSSVHIQREYPLPSELYRFLDQYYDKLKDYYNTIFNLPLSRGGNDFNQYYFIDHNVGERTNVPSDSKSYLESRHILVGLLFFKMYQIDGNIELDSVNDFIDLLFNEYEEEKQALRRLITGSASEKGSDRNDEKVENTINKAFDKFNELGWLVWENEIDKNRFKVLPSFERLRLMYQPQIDNINDLIQKFKDEE